MTIRSRTAALLIVGLILCMSTADAQNLGGRVVIFRGPQPPACRSWQPQSAVAPRRAPSYDEYYQYMNARFPKYYGGFHANYFQSIGTTPGDIGLRGNGIFATPW